MKKYLILAINPGSTSTKLAIYENENLFQSLRYLMTHQKS